MTKLEQADSKTFEYLDFCFGKDLNHIFYLDKVIPIDRNNFILDKNGFIYDDKNIVHFQHQILIDVKTFKVIEYQSSSNPFIGTFILEDKNGQYEYNRNSKEGIIKPVAL